MTLTSTWLPFPLTSNRIEVVGFRKDGRPIFPIRGGSEPPAGDPPAGDPPKADDQPKPDATDEFGQSLGFPKDTAVKDMKPEQQAAYWRTESKKQQKKAEDAERKLQQSAQNGDGTGTVRDQQQGQGNQTATVDEAKVKREAAKDAALATLTATLALRGKNDDERAELLDLVDPAKFVTSDGNIDAAKVKTYVDRVAPAGNGQNDGTGGTPGQGRFTPGGQSKRELGEAEAQRRFAGQKDQPQRGALGGLRR